jgi:cytidylate kinase
VSGAPVIAIDGPSGSGKGTISRRVAATLGWHLLDSGALYRLTGLAGHRAGLDGADEAGHARLAAAMDIEFGSTAAGSDCVRLDGADVTQEIRTEAAGERASRVASFPAVRAALLERQRRFARPPGLVADGRDMGSVVFPGAALKVFLTATAAERARRRFQQLRAAGAAATLAAVEAEIAVRDARDTSRAASPLLTAPGAVVVDSTAMSPEAVVAEVLRLARERGLER